VIEPIQNCRADSVSERKTVRFPLRIAVSIQALIPGLSRKNCFILV
jgi:hypothetical protein